MKRLPLSFYLDCRLNSQRAAYTAFHNDETAPPSCSASAEDY